MLASSIPVKISVPFASGASGSFVRTIPIPSQINTDPGAASFTDGFVPLNGTPIAAGGIPPDERDMNGILLAITQWNQWANAGGPLTYDSAFATAIGGYPRGAVLMSALVLGNYWLNTADNNTTDPDSSGAANWINPPGLAGTGTLGYTVFTTLPTGWVWANANSTIGNASSNASYANADALFLFNAIWNNFPNSQCPIYTSSNVATTRGANAYADFAANKQLQMLDMPGTGIIGQDNSTGRLTSVPVISGSANAPGALIGGNLHTLTAAELATHTHSGTTGNENANHSHTGSGTTGTDSPDHSHVYSAPSPGPGTGTTPNYFDSGNVSANTGGASTRHTHAYSFTTSTENVVHQHAFTTDGGTVGNGAHNTVHRSMTVNWLLKL